MIATWSPFPCPQDSSSGHVSTSTAGSRARRPRFPCSNARVAEGPLAPRAFGASATALAYDVLALPEQYLLCFLVGGNRLGIDFLRQLVGADSGLSRLDRLLPALQVREIVEVLLLPFRHHPGIARDVGDRVLADDEFAVG